MNRILSTFLALALLGLTLPAFAAADTELVLQEVQGQAPGTASVRILIKNPSAQPIVSVQSWLKYDTSKLKKAPSGAINTESSKFDFVAPGENTFDEKQGIVKIGRSVVGSEVIEPEIEVATVTFQVLAAGGKVEFYDYQSDHTGHTSVRIMQEGMPVNILSKKPNSITIGGSATNDTTTLPTSIPVVSTPAFPTTPILTTSVAPGRPENLRITTNGASMIAAWPQEKLKKREISQISGYNLYYGTVSGTYLHRRTMGKVNTYELTNLEPGKRYFFALTAYNSTQTESDFSDEVSVVIGSPESSSSPLGAMTTKLLASLPKQTESGPATAMLLLFGLLAIIFSWQGQRKRV